MALQIPAAAIGILTYLGKYISTGINRLQRIERLVTEKDYHLRIANLFNTFGVKSDQNELFEKIDLFGEVLQKLL